MKLAEKKRLEEATLEWKVVKVQQPEQIIPAPVQPAVAPVTPDEAIPDPVGVSLARQTKIDDDWNNKAAKSTYAPSVEMPDPIIIASER